MRFIDVRVPQPRLAAGLMTLVAGMTAGLTATPAAAQMFGWTDPPRATKHYRRPPMRSDRVQRQETERRDEGRSRERVKAEPKEPPPQMVYAVVSLADQRISVYGADGLITSSRVSTGQAGHRTPTGIFTILEKQRWHQSNIYSGAPMPFMQRITWSGIAMHTGVVPGYPASHGCIRLPGSFAARIWEMTRVGLRVMVSPVDVTPAEFADARLPVPKLVPASDLPAPPAPARVADAANAVVPAAETPPAEPRMLTPIEAAVAMKGKAVAAVAAAKKNAETALKIAREAASEADDAADELRKARLALDDLRARNALPEQIAAAEKRVEEAKAADDAKSPRSYELARAAGEAQQAVEKAQADVSEAVRRQAPVTVVISKKEGAILVKQGKKPVYEGPITIKDPELPLGNHMLIATAPVEGGAGLKWMALDAPWQAEPEKSRLGRKARDREAEPAPAPLKAATAKEAWDRVEIPAEVTTQLASLMWVGSSIVITDKGLSNENGEHTDLIVNIP